MRLPSAVSDQYVYFVGISGSDRFTRQIGMSGKFKVYRSRNGAAAAIYTTPTINETDATNMPGVYELLVDEDVTIDAGDQTQEIAFHITTTDTALSTDSIVPVTRVIELWRSDVTPGTTLLVNSGGDLPGLETATDMLSNIQDVLIPNLDVSLETATDMLSNIQDVLLPAIETSITYATRGIDQTLLGLEFATSTIFVINTNVVAAEVSLTYATRGIDQLITEHAAFETSITYATRGIDQIALGVAAATDGVSLLTSAQVVRESTVGLS